MARWWCRMVVRICALPARRTCCNGPTRSGMSNAPLVSRADEALTQSKLPSQIRRSRLWLGHRDAGHLAVTMIREPKLAMLVRRILTALAGTLLLSGVAGLAHAQSAAPKAAKSAKSPEPKAVAAVAGGAEPTLIGQFGTWGAYS